MFQDVHPIRKYSLEEGRQMKFVCILVPPGEGRERFHMSPRRGTKLREYMIKIIFSSINS
jgi:hypothetical protein